MLVTLRPVVVAAARRLELLPGSQEPKGRRDTTLGGPAASWCCEIQPPHRLMPTGRITAWTRLRPLICPIREPPARIVTGTPPGGRATPARGRPGTPAAVRV